MRSATPGAVVAVIATALSVAALAKLPPQSDEAKAAAAEAAGKAAWADKVGAYQLCRSQDRVADAYRKQAVAAGKPAPTPPVSAAPAASAGSAAAPAPIVIGPCADPGPYTAASTITPAAAKPLESSGAHSPSGTAVGPPSQKATSAEISPKK